MLLNMGKLDGRRVLGRKSVELMTTNHLAPELLPYEIAKYNKIKRNHDNRRKDCLHPDTTEALDFLARYCEISNPELG